MASEVVLDERLWRLLPKEVLDIILLRLPVAARCRLRCVCRRWREVLPSLSDWTEARSICRVTVDWQGRKAKFFCHSEEKWFSLPFNEPQPLWGVDWEIVDVDAGLVCYLCRLDGRFWISIGNPLKHSARVIAPSNLVWDQLNLSVDRETGAFKVLVVNYEANWVGVYNSTEACWCIWTEHPWRGVLNEKEYEQVEFFLWNNVIYAYSILQTADLGDFVMPLSVESRQWTTIEAKFPRETSAWKVQYIVGGKDQVILVQYFKPLQRFSIWKLSGNGLSNVPDFSNWQKLYEGPDRATAKVLSERHLTHVCYATGYICLTFCGQRLSKDGSKYRRLVDRCLTYSVSAKTCRVMRNPVGWRNGSAIYMWEPSLGMDIKSQGVEGSMIKILNSDYSARAPHPALDPALGEEFD